MSDLRALYQEVILDHTKSPRNHRVIDDASRSAQGDNPLCGDKLQVWLDLDGEIIRDVSFQGSGCAISTASASLMTEAVKGKSVTEVDQLYTGFHELLTGDPSVEGEAGDDLGKLRVFSGVREYPVRVKCATLAWHTLKAALGGAAAAPVSTE